MRVITGDECGLVKESIPELSRRNEDVGKNTQRNIEDGVSIIGNTTSDFSLNMSRTRGVVKLAFCNSQLNEDGALSFGALRLDGSLERWDGLAPCESHEDRMCRGSYKIAESMSNVFAKSTLPNDVTNAVWHRGRPIEMCSIPNQNSTRESNMVACCSSMGSIAIADLNNTDKGVMARHAAFSKNQTNSTISNSKGNLINKDMATTMAVDHEGKKIAVGGRERSITLVDVETGKNLWKVCLYKTLKICSNLLGLVKPRRLLYLIPAYAYFPTVAGQEFTTKSPNAPSTTHMVDYSSISIPDRHRSSLWVHQPSSCRYSLQTAANI